MYMNNKLLKARGIIYSVGLAVVVAIVVWKLVVRWSWFFSAEDTGLRGNAGTKKF